jgi:transglutaminase-like putative cysteine protease
MSPVYLQVPSVVTLPPKVKRGAPAPIQNRPVTDPAERPSRVITTLPAGDAGTAKTVGWMRKLIHEGSKKQEVRETAANLAMHHATDQGKIGAIFDFVKTKMKYVRDPLHQEMLAGAQYHFDTLSGLGYARGDCDDHTIMLGAMLEAVGYPTRITTARMKPGPGSFDHVYLEVNDRRSWIPLDASNKKREAGEDPPSSRKRRW